MSWRSSMMAVIAGTLVLWGCGSGRLATTSATPAANSSTVHPAAATLAPQTTSSPHSAVQAPVAQQSPSSPSITVERPGRSSRTPVVTVVVDLTQNRHPISPLIYGVNFPLDTNYLANSGATFVRWGGNASSRYNWTNFDTNAGSDWYFANRAMDTNPLYQDSTYFISTIANAGASPIMTIGLLDWVAKDDSSSSFSVAKYGAQCGVNPYNSDQGNGVQADCSTNVTGNDPTDAHVPLLDLPGQGDPANAVYRNQWVGALSTKFGTAPHFYNMDNEMDIWSSTHRDVHPTPMNYHDLRGTFLKEAKVIKAWDPQAVLFGPVSCCWLYYWNSAAGASDKAVNAGIDFLPWWLNEVAISDRVDSFRSLDVFDVHAYTDSPGTSGYTLAEKQALTLRITRDWWDPAYVSESGAINQDSVTQTQPLKKIPFRIPRMRAILNSIYPGTPMAMTEWNEGLAVWGTAAESDFTTALADADAYGILGRERVYAASRWTAPASNTPAYQALKLFRNYDGAHHTFGSISISAGNNGDVNLFSSYAAVDESGTTMSILLINKDAQATVPVRLTLPDFLPATVTSYTLSSANPQTIVSSSSQSWQGFWNVGPYTAMLLVVKGQSIPSPSVEWDLNPDTVMMPANGALDLHPKIVSASGTFTLTSVQSDAGITVSATQPNVTGVQNGTIHVVAGASPGFYHYTARGIDGLGIEQVQSGWIVVGNSAATLGKIGDNQVAPAGSVITLSVTLDPAQSGGTAEGASILFSTDAGNLPNRIARTNNTGQASVQLTLPSTPGTVHVTAEGPIPLGHPVATFTATAQ